MGGLLSAFLGLKVQSILKDPKSESGPTFAKYLQNWLGVVMAAPAFSNSITPNWITLGALRYGRSSSSFC